MLKKVTFNALRTVRHRNALSSFSSLRFMGTALATAERPTISNITVDETNADNLVVTWTDGQCSSFPSIYLRDNCNEYKTSNGQRLFETYELSDDRLHINNCSVDPQKEAIQIMWSDDVINSFPIDWLYENSLNVTHRQQRLFDQQRDSAAKGVVFWDSKVLTNGPNVVCTYSELEQRRIEVYRELRRYGVCIIDKAPTQETYDSNGDPPVIVAGNIVGFVRTTNYGKYFDVQAMPEKDSNNLAYTSKGLSVHTDNCYRTPTPGIQLLHCIKQAELSPSGNGKDGNTLLTDGFKVAQYMKENHPAEFELLSTIKRPFTYFDLSSGYKFHKERYVIGVDECGRIEDIHFNNRTASSLNWNIDEDKVKPYYKAWQLFAKLSNEQFAVECRLESGQIVIFDNMRILHGRAGYVENKNCVDRHGWDASRHLQGCYIDHDTVWGRLDAFEYVQQKHKTYAK